MNMSSTDGQNFLMCALFGAQAFRFLSTLSNGLKDLQEDFLWSCLIYSNFGNILGAKNSSRYPNYFRVDVSMARKMKLFGIESELKFQIVNLTDYYNVLLYNWDHESSPSKVEAYSMFPRIITFGWEFKL